ncbi:MAG: FAD-dependent thymidylate synthase [Candidatus Methanofastidiosum methylothiophilum]|uniref:Flavin-dependent thymidylate synthase n=1 Tax=Candidatus Methanofastidiosum methylothiophilum TaxID=1705564 RepID=A0A150J006_9EURY|nr:MAG: FAD-dependent thymidylate synthase [Candidatus Methanofastidiosum methylthiophilus]KYC47955.1 MAG: FAD-dependent thymidylate synthase [Candidatus Methanofastidiosum methylthiophilus]KYC50573.1 MAG: FAD-dependent thymidylate synthase [Candidatus Methanofastidiosum methylthiophilus]
MKVVLLEYTRNPETVCAVAALTSMKEGTPSDMLKEIDEDNAKKRIQRVVGYGHYSVIEHANFTFSIEGISRACSHQLVRHRIASFTQQSQRYVKMEDVPFVTPPSIKKNKSAEEIFKNSLKETAETYKKLLELGITPEDARFVLPNATKTNLVMTMNARELLHLFNLRCCNRAQWEIRDMAWEMLYQVLDVSPALFETSGPKCISEGICTEGKSSCGCYKLFEGKNIDQRRIIVKEFYK